MKISRVEIQNFRNFEHINVNTSQIMMLVGPNNTGKSNFIYALRLVLDSRLSIAQRTLKTEDFWKGITPWCGTAIKITVEFSDYADDKNLCSILSSHNSSTRESVASLTYIFRPKQSVTEPDKAKEQDYYPVLCGGDGETIISWDVLKNLSISYIDALRDAQSELISNKHPLKNLLSLFGINANILEDAEIHIRAINQIIADIPQIQDLERDISSILDSIREHIHELSPVIRTVTQDKDAVLSSLRMLLQGGQLLAINTTSLGLANLLFLALYLLDIEKRETIDGINNGTEFEFVIPAIEEPEAHLHPHVQRLLFRRFLNRRNAPLILSTHSPYIASVASPDSFLMFSQTDSGASKVTSTASIKDILTDREFDNIKRYLDVTRAELLFSRSVIFVEGDAEEFLLPTLAHLSGLDLDRYGITVCNVRGVDFIPYVQFVKNYAHGLGIFFVVLTDGDKYAYQKREAIKWARENGCSETKVSDLKKQLGIKSSVQLFDRLQSLNIPQKFYYGLKRGIDILLAMDIDPEQLKIVESAYNTQDWETVFSQLRSFGIFVNDWTLESSLIDNGFAPLILKALNYCGVGDGIYTSLRSDIKNGEISSKRKEYWIKRIDDTGKGRVAQTLSSILLDEETTHLNLPSYIQDAFSFLKGKLEQPPPNIPDKNDDVELTISVSVRQASSSDVEHHQENKKLILTKAHLADKDISAIVKAQLDLFIDAEFQSTETKIDNNPIESI